MARRRIPPKALSCVVLLDDPRYDPVAVAAKGRWLHSPFVVRWDDRDELRVVEVEVVIDDAATPRPVAVRITSDELPTANDYKALPLGSLLHQAVELVGFPGPDYPLGTRMGQVRGPVERGWFGIARDPLTTPNKAESRAAHPRRIQLSDEFLLRIVEIKRQLEKQGLAPKPVIAAREGVHSQTVAKWFQAARARGFLEKHPNTAKRKAKR